MCVEQKDFLQWIAEQCESFGASPEMHSELQILASRVNLKSIKDFQTVSPLKKQQTNFSAELQGGSIELGPSWPA